MVIKKGRASWMIGRLCLFSFLHEGKKRVMKKQLRNLMEIYKKAEEDYELEARKTFTEYLKKQLKKSVKGEDRKKKDVSLRIMKCVAVAIYRRSL